MCRIVGIADFNKQLGPELEPSTIKMRDSLAHGGSDDAGLFISQDRKIALGHRRLSIIDISSAGHQPMNNKEQNIWITYNGEIYNFQELRNELIKLGYEFKSKSDTEVIIYGYEEWGIECLLSRLRGMFAFALYDCRKNTDGNKLILARDRFGIKPLYFYQDKERFIFASEVKAILKSSLVSDELNLEALVRFLQLGSVPVPLTTIRNVFSLPAGHYMVVSNSTNELKRYWYFLNYLDQATSREKSPSLSEAIVNTRNLLLESVKLHLISDVPLGVFLSGGIDSSSLVALASGFRGKENLLTTLSVVFNELAFNEANYAKLVADNYKTDHREVLLTSHDFIGEIPKIFSAMDQPTIDGVNTYFISKAAKEAGLTVVLSGIGGDEVFLGYSHYKKAKYLDPSLKFFTHLPKWISKNSLQMIAEVGTNIGFKGAKKLTYLNEINNENTYLMFRGLFTPYEIQDLLGITEKEFKSFGAVFKSLNGSVPSSLIESFDFLDFYHYLQNQILKDTDFMSMAHAVEIRVPFLDHYLVEYVVNLSTELKLQNGVNKSLLLNVIGNDLPKEVWNRPKMGFTFPFDEWVRKECKMFEDQSLNQNYLNQKFVKRIWEGFKKGQVHWSRVWALTVANNFCKNTKENVLI